MRCKTKRIIVIQRKKNREKERGISRRNVRAFLFFSMDDLRALPRDEQNYTLPAALSRFSCHQREARANEKQPGVSYTLLTINELRSEFTSRDTIDSPLPCSPLRRSTGGIYSSDSTCKVPRVETCKYVFYKEKEGMSFDGNATLANLVRTTTTRHPETNCIVFTLKQATNVFFKTLTMVIDDRSP